MPRYYICQKTRVKGRYRITRMTCGALYWSQDYLTCVRKAQPGCESAATPIATVTSSYTTR